MHHSVVHGDKNRKSSHVPLESSAKPLNSNTAQRIALAKALENEGSAPAPAPRAGSGARNTIAERRVVLAAALQSSPSSMAGATLQPPASIPPPSLPAPSDGHILAAVAESRVALARSLSSKASAAAGGSVVEGGGRRQYPRESAEALKEQRIALALALQSGMRESQRFIA